MSDLFTKVHDNFPVFLIDDKKFSILYTPGYLITLDKISVNELIFHLKNPLSISDPALRNAILILLNKSQNAVEHWEHQRRTPFSTECLTIHTGNECNFNCSYCYSKVNITGNKDIHGFPDLKMIKNIVRQITESKDKNTKKLTLVYHGSGEPTFHWQQLVESFNGILEIVQDNDINLFSYIATNGCLTNEQIDWLAVNFNLIGISCDGPKTIQNKQRRSSSNKSFPIEKICGRILEMGGNFEIRTTITKDSISEQLSISKYLIDKCKAKLIRFEPVYFMGKNKFVEKDAELFFKYFLQAQKYVKTHGSNITYAGVRIGEFHGTYCDVLRNTLRLTSDSITRNCFCLINNEEDFITGKYNSDIDILYLSSKINELKMKASKIPDQCNNCINVYHCSRGCPDYCIIQNGHNEPRKLNPFRCRLHQLLAVEKIKSLVKNQLACVS